MPVIYNAKIRSTFLGFEDHDCFTFSLMVDYDGVTQGAGGYRLDLPLPNSESVGRAKSCTLLMEILRVLGIKQWEHLPHTYIRIKKDNPNGRIIGIGNILEDKWLMFNEFFEGN